MLKLTNSLITVLQTYISMVVSKERFVTATSPVIKNNDSGCTHGFMQKYTVTTKNKTEIMHTRI